MAAKNPLSKSETHYKNAAENCDELFKCWASCFAAARDALKESGFSEEDAMQILVAHGCCVDKLHCPA